MEHGETETDCFENERKRKRNNEKKKKKNSCSRNLSENKTESDAMEKKHDDKGRNI
jgi:hypothetical protein